MGIYGGAYLPAADCSTVEFFVTDGVRSASFGGTPSNLTYTILNNDKPDDDPEPLSLEDRIAAAKALIKSVGVLDFDLQFNEDLSYENVMVFNRVLDGLLQIEENSYTSYITATFDPDGYIVSMVSRLNNVQEVTVYPIRSAQEAWDIVLADPDDPRVKYTLASPYHPSRTVDSGLTNTYTIGEKVDLYSYLSVYPSAEAGGKPWVTAEGFTLQGDLTCLLGVYEKPPELTPKQKDMVAEGIVSQEWAANWSKFFHIWGQSTLDEYGARVLQVEGWENSAMPVEILEGVFTMTGSQTVFTDQEGGNGSYLICRKIFPWGQR